MHFYLPLTGAKFSAYFYMDMIIVNLLHIIPTEISQSLFAEDSYGKTDLKVYFKKLIKIISIIIIPAIIINSLFANYILLEFEKEYSDEGFILLKLLLISGIFISINAIGSVIINIKYKIITIKLLNIRIFLEIAHFVRNDKKLKKSVSASSQFLISKFNSFFIFSLLNNEHFGL